MKGKVTCPSCKHTFLIELPKGEEKQIVSCPKCDQNFNIKFKKADSDIEICTWEEHGEPRKTVLSSIKPKSKQPIIAAILLVCVFSIGITTSAFSEVFIETTLDVASVAGGTGEVDFKIINSFNETIGNVTVKINGEIVDQNDKGIYIKKKVELGIQSVEISKTGFETKKTEVLVIPFIVTDTTFTLDNNSGNVEETEFNSFGCSLILAIFSVFAIFSVITCIKREHFDVAIAGSILAIFSFGFFFIGSILSIIAFVFIYKSRDEFKNGDKGKIF